MIEPLHVAAVGQHSLRFFASPLNDGRPDLPWHAVDDLHQCLRLDRRQRRIFLAKLRKWKQPHTVATATGIVTLAPHFMAQGTVDAWVEDGYVPASVRDEYDHASSEALEKLMLGLTFPSEQWPAWLADAMNRWDDAAVE
jgi:hypothetical protein